jgi:hypothetical protein
MGELFLVNMLQVQFLQQSTVQNNVDVSNFVY